MLQELIAAADEVCTVHDGVRIVHKKAVNRAIANTKEQKADPPSSTSFGARTWSQNAFQIYFTTC